MRVLIRLALFMAVTALSAAAALTLMRNSPRVRRRNRQKSCAQNGRDPGPATQESAGVADSSPMDPSPPASDSSSEPHPEAARAPHAEEFLSEALADGLTLDDLEKAYTLRILEMADGNRSKAAEMLGIARRTLYRKLQDWGIEDKDEDDA